MLSKKNKIAYMHNRSYGDLVINLYCRKFFLIDSVDFVPFYLHDLYKLISNNSKNVTILKKIIDKPAFINLRKSRIYEIIKSFKQLRNAFDKIKNCYPDYMIFQDHKRWGQDMYFGFSTCTPNKLSNIYMSHMSFYKNIGLKSIKPINETLQNDGVVRIFPNSNHEYKNINSDIVYSICNQLNDLNTSHEVVYLDGEKIFDFKHNYSIIPRKFSELISKLKYSRFNISCDSLPAHLSSFYNINTLVLISEKSKYWLPLDSFNKKNYVALETIENGNHSYLFEMINKNYNENFQL